MKRFLYWAKPVENDNAETYNFISEAFIEIGTIVKNDQGKPCRIVDLAVEFPISAQEYHSNFELARSLGW